MFGKISKAFNFSENNIGGSSISQILENKIPKPKANSSNGFISRIQQLKESVVNTNEAVRIAGLLIALDDSNILVNEEGTETEKDIFNKHYDKNNVRSLYICSTIQKGIEERSASGHHANNQQDLGLAEYVNQIAELPEKEVINRCKILAESNIQLKSILRYLDYIDA